jgi:hypothetical protein
MTPAKTTAARGCSELLAAAAKLKITEATARSHAARIFAKKPLLPVRPSSSAGFFETALPGTKPGSPEREASRRKPGKVLQA